MNSSFTIRKAKDSEVDLYIDWGNSSGWNMNPQVTKNFYKEYPDGWFLGEIFKIVNQIEVLELSKKVIALVYCTKYPTNIGFIGYFMVDEEYRGLGYGHKLLQHVLDMFIFNSGQGQDKCSAVGLFTSPINQLYYQRFGFESKESTKRFKGKVNPILFKKSKFCEKEEEQFNSINNSRLTAIKENDVEEVSKYDQHFSQTFRPGFWRNWASSSEQEGIFSNDFCLIYRNEKDNEIQGLGALRPLPEGTRLGPIYAKSFEIAEIIFQQLCQSVSRHTMLIIDVHETNERAVQFYKKLGLQETLLTKFMWKGDYSHDLDKVKATYALASLDFN